MSKYCPVIAVGLLLYCSLTLAAPLQSLGGQNPTLQSAPADVNSLQAEVATLTRQLEAVQRDQLNYKIEKDLLKEAYSSSLQSVNLVITIVLGVFGVLGFLGIRSIREIHRDYAAELDRIRTLKGSFESELESLRVKQREFEDKVSKLVVENARQDQRLKILEIVEKVNTLVRDRSYQWALEHIAVGLSLDPGNVMLLTFKSQCFGKLGRLVEAIDVSKHLLSIEPNNLSHMTNLLEYLALSGDASEFENTYRARRVDIDKLNGGHLTMYLKSVLAVMIGNFTDANNILVPYVAAQPTESKKRIDGWSFDDALTVLASLSDSPRKQFLLGVVKYFQGEIDGPSFASQLSALVATK